MREFHDRAGRLWQVSEVGYYGFGRPGQTDANTAWVHFISSEKILKLEAPRGSVPAMSEDELAQLVDWMLAREAVEVRPGRMREFRDASGTEWLVTEEGLPGAERGTPGRLALRFISPKGTRYLVPVPEFWDSIADNFLLDYLTAAKPSIESS
jgi:hypothetical protein